MSILVTNYQDRSNYRTLFFKLRDNGYLYLQSRKLSNPDSLSTVKIPEKYSTITSDTVVTTNIRNNDTTIKGILGEYLQNSQYIIAIDSVIKELATLKANETLANINILNERIQELNFTKSAFSKLTISYLTAFDDSDLVETSKNRSMLENIDRRYKFVKNGISLNSFDRNSLTDANGNALLSTDSTDPIKSPDVQIREVIGETLLAGVGFDELFLLNQATDLIDVNQFALYKMTELYFRGEPVSNTKGYYPKFNAANHLIIDIYQLVGGTKVFVNDPGFDFSVSFTECWITNVQLGDFAVKTDKSILDKSGNVVKLEAIYVDGIPAKLALEESVSRELPIPIKIGLPDLLSFFKLDWMNTIVEELDDLIDTAEDKLQDFRQTLRDKFNY